VLIEQILQAKGSEVATVGAATTVADALTELRDRNIGALVVSDDGATLDGIVSERDIVRALADRGAAVLDEHVSNLMSTDVATTDRHATAEQLMSLMTDRRIRHIPIVEDGSLVGIVSIGDVVKSRVGELETERHQLVDYITTGR
jgi:CBS domain-containing protein